MSSNTMATSQDLFSLDSLSTNVWGWISSFDPSQSILDDVAVLAFLAAIFFGASKIRDLKAKVAAEKLKRHVKIFADDVLRYLSATGATNAEIEWRNDSILAKIHVTWPGYSISSFFLLSRSPAEAAQMVLLEWKKHHRPYPRAKHHNPPWATKAETGWWSVLGLQKSADVNAIKAAHRKLLMVHHPDRGGSAAKMSEINAARDEGLKALSSG